MIWISTCYQNSHRDRQKDSVRPGQTCQAAIVRGLRSPRSQGKHTPRAACRKKGERWKVPSPKKKDGEVD